jgi:myo-inositol-1(or 4)-monophosphatase
MKQKYKIYEDIAIKASLIGGDILKKYFKNISSFEIKDGAGLVTKADKESEDAICSFLNKKTPEFSILGEESGLSQRGENKWIIDPLDGTTNFFHGFPYFNVSIGLEIEGEIVVGVVNNPISKEVYHCSKNTGAYKNKKQIHVSKTKELAKSLLGTGFAYMRGSELDESIKLFKEFTYLCHGIRRPGAAALDLCQLASGTYDGFYEKTLSPWDVAASSLLIKEAGGKLSLFDGSEFSVYSESIVASNVLLHDEIIKIINK